jgi:hypothetical protein
LAEEEPEKKIGPKLNKKKSRREHNTNHEIQSSEVETRSAISTISMLTKIPSK